VVFSADAAVAELMTTTVLKVCARLPHVK